MMAILEGFVAELPGIMWLIEDDVSNPLCRFNSRIFPNFANGDPVYFVDDIAPMNEAENVQVRNFVDDLVETGTPRNGATNDALALLGKFAMQKLLSNTAALAAGQPSTFLQINAKMMALASEMNANHGGRATVPVLRALGL
jgi:hypothetical protein